MYSTLISNFSCLSSSEMFLFFCSLIFATAAGVTAFLLLSSNGIKDFKQRFFFKTRITQLPILTEDGKLMDSKEDLEAHLEVLENKLLEKVSEIEVSKTRVEDAKQSIERLHSTQFQVKKYYVKLREEIKKSEDDCKNLQEQIDDYKRRRAALDLEMKKNEEYYRNLLEAVRSSDSLDSSRASSKLSMNSASSSTTSFHDSTSYVYLDDKPGTQKKETLPPLPDNETPPKEDASNNKNTENISHSSPVSKTTSKSNMIEESSQGLQRRLSNSNLDSQVLRDNTKRTVVNQKNLLKTTSPTKVKVSKDSSKHETHDQKRLQKKHSNTNLENQKEVSRNELELKGSFLLPNKLSGCGIQKFKVKSLKGEICCCGCSKCPGTCNLARCIKLGFLKPKDILSVEVAEHVDVLTGKIICDPSISLHKHIPLESQAKRPLSPRNMGRFS